MDDKFEIADQDLESVEAIVEADVIHASTDTTLEGFNDNLVEALAGSTSEENDYVTLFEHKRNELGKIQHDLNNLMDRLNNFISSSKDNLNKSEDVDRISEKTTANEDELTEKQDGPQEKELIKEKSWHRLLMEDVYISDGLNPPEVNWDALAPFIQNVVGDLQNIRNLNRMTNSVLERIRNVTGAEDATTD